MFGLARRADAYVMIAAVAREVRADVGAVGLDDDRDFECLDVDGEDVDVVARLLDGGEVDGAIRRASRPGTPRSDSRA